MGARCDTTHGAEPRVEVADILRTYGEASQQTHRLSGGQRLVMRDIVACRTAVLGGQMTQCDHCGVHAYICSQYVAEGARDGY